MKTLQKFGGFAALYMAVAHLIGIWISSALAPASSRCGNPRIAPASGTPVRALRDRQWRCAAAQAPSLGV